MVNFFIRLALFAVIVGLIGSFVLLVMEIDRINARIYEGIVHHEQNNIIESIEIFKNQLLDRVEEHNTSLLSYLQQNIHHREDCNDALELIRNKATPYIYLLYDDHGKFRYLCDGSIEKGRFFQKFDIAEYDKWSATYSSGKIAILDQQKYQGLWKSILIPIQKDNETLGMVVVDYSTAFPQEIQKLTAPFKNFLYLILGAISLLVLFTIFQFILSVRIRKKSFIDPLTQIYNRHFLHHFPKRYSFQKHDLYLIDIDHFKRINDLYGHYVGDEAIKHIVNIINRHITHKDFFIRVGGEEFLVLKDRTDHQSASSFANTIRTEIENTPLFCQEKGLSLNMTVSIGVHRKTKMEKNINVALQHTDMALYKAKRSGRNYIVEVEGTLLKKIHRELSFAYIKDLIIQEKVICYFQPIYCKATAKVVKYETLVRLVDHDGQIIMPGQFLPLIWGTNSYLELTRQILHQAVEKFRHHDKKFTINFSIQDLLDLKIIRLIEEVAEKESDTIKRMQIEVLEHDHFEKIERLQQLFSRLKALGIKMILDDFGSGHANFLVVEQLDFDALKIDGTIIESITTHTKAKTLLEALVYFAHKEGIEIVAECVSSKEIYDALQDIPVDYLQGFYLGKPQPEIL